MKNKVTCPIFLPDVLAIKLVLFRISVPTVFDNHINLDD